MSTCKIRIDWCKIAGARTCPSENSFYKCPVQNCEHEGFETKRGVRKHLHTIHPWFYYFDEKPSTTSVQDDMQSRQSRPKAKPVKGKRSFETSNIPCYPMTSPAGTEFASWLTSAAGGGKSQTQSNQTSKRCLKFLKASYEEGGELTEDIIDFCLGSPSILCKFISTMEDRWQLSYPGQMGYLNAIADLIDYRRVKLPCRKVLDNVAVTEIYLKRAKKCIGKMMKVQWTKDMDIDTLDAKGNWASLEDMLEVIPYHLPRYKGILVGCKTERETTTSSSVTAYDLSFANKFIANYLFINVKGTRPMTYQYLTVDMVENAKQNGGYVDQRQFKTAAKYGFDTLILDRTNLRILDDFIKYIRPRLKPKCNYLLVTRNGTQYDKLCDMMSKLVYDAIGKYIHPTRLRQIIETESDKSLSPEDRQAVSEDQKHSSRVAQVYYKKKRSREVASKARAGLAKLQKTKRSRVENELRRTLELSQDSQSEKEQDAHANRRIESFPSSPESSRRIESRVVNPFDDMSDSSDEVETVVQFPSIGKSPCQSSSSSGAAPPPPPPPPSSSLNATSQDAQQRLKFTSEEDQHLERGIQKHGRGQWTAILRDPELRFQEGRTADAMMKRTLSRSFSKHYSA